MFGGLGAIVMAAITIMAVMVIGVGTTEPVIVEKETIKEVPVEKEVVKIVERIVTAVPPARATFFSRLNPTAAHTPTAQPAAGQVSQGGFKPLYGGVINMSQYADVRQRLIHQSYVLNMTMSPVFNNLVEWNPETDDVSDLRCDMCTSWELADDGKTYTFRLHEDAKWHDGVPVTAADVVFSMESMVNPDQFKVLEGRSTSSHANAGLYYETGNSRAIDDKTVEIVTKFPSGGFLLAIANETATIIPRHTVVDQEIAQGGRDLKVLNGSGPFKLTEYVKEVSVSYEKDPNYWKTDRNGNARPYIDGIKMFIISDSGRQIAAF